MNRSLYITLLAGVALVLVGAAFFKFGSQRAQAPIDLPPPAMESMPAPESAAPAAETNTSAASEAQTGSEAAVSAPAEPAAGTYTAAQVAANATASSCWTIVAGSVYDVTTWVSRHPGGSRAILGMCGRDATVEFTSQHGSSAQAQAALVSFRIGALAQ